MEEVHSFLEKPKQLLKCTAQLKVVPITALRQITSVRVRNACVSKPRVVLIVLGDSLITNPVLTRARVLRLHQEIYTLAMLAGAHLGPRKCLTEEGIAPVVVLVHLAAISPATRIRGPVLTVPEAASMDTVTGDVNSIAAILAAPCQTGVDTWVAGITLPQVGVWVYLD